MIIIMLIIITVQQKLFEKNNHLFFAKGMKREKKSSDQYDVFVVKTSEEETDGLNFILMYLIHIYFYLRFNKQSVLFL